MTARSPRRSGRTRQDKRRSTFFSYRYADALLHLARTELLEAIDVTTRNRQAIANNPLQDRGNRHDFGASGIPLGASHATSFQKPGGIDIFGDEGHPPGAAAVAAKLGWSVERTPIFRPIVENSRPLESPRNWA